MTRWSPAAHAMCCQKGHACPSFILHPNSTQLPVSKASLSLISQSLGLQSAMNWHMSQTPAALKALKGISEQEGDCRFSHNTARALVLAMALRCQPLEDFKQASFKPTQLRTCLRQKDNCCSDCDKRQAWHLHVPCRTIINHAASSLKNHMNHARSGLLHSTVQSAVMHCTQGRSAQSLT